MRCRRRDGGCLLPVLGVLDGSGMGEVEGGPVGVGFVRWEIGLAG